MKTKHSKKLSCGVTVDLFLDEDTCVFTLEFDPPPPFGKESKPVFIAEFEPWKNAIIEDWNERNSHKGKRVVHLSIFDKPTTNN